MKKFFLVRTGQSILQSSKRYCETWVLKEVPTPELIYTNPFTLCSVNLSCDAQVLITFFSKENAIIFAEKNNFEIAYIEEECLGAMELKSYKNNFLN